MGASRTRAYRNGELADHDFPVASVSEHLAMPGTVVWIDLLDPSEEEVLELADELDLHELAVEDVLGSHQRPKLDRYDTHLFLSCHAVELDEQAAELVDIEVDAFVSQRWLVTVRANDRFPIEPVLARWDRSPNLLRFGVGYLLYGLLDVLVDGYFDTVERFDTYYDDVSDGIFDDKPLDPSQQRHGFEMRRALVRFHRLVLATREAIGALMRRDQDTVPDELYPYYQDVYDHILRISESTDSLRDLVTTIVETNLSLRDYRQNLIVKKVSGWAAIIAVPALITGYYGMNVPYPGIGRTAGFWASLVLLIGGTVGLYLYFRKHDWL
ncbi:MAG TPA: magnesium transporter CorA family protein [Actinomycetota bacterium]|nr:magnesium transporter CorA family protein [Actinomycetota bacterium]